MVGAEIYWGMNVINWSRVSELQEEVGDEALGEVLDLFTSEVDEGLARLKQATDPNARAAEFHFLKGAALNLGLDEMARICAKGETTAQAGADTGAECSTVTEKFPACCHELRTQWRAQLGLG